MSFSLEILRDVLEEVGGLDPFKARPTEIEEADRARFREHGIPVRKVIWP